MNSTSLLRSRGIRKVAWHVGALAVVGLMLGPFFWMVSSSLKPLGQLFVYPPQLIPKVLDWHTYPQVFATIPMTRYLFNSVFITGFSIVGQLFTCSLAGYAFARIPFKGRGWLFAVLMVALMIPPQVIIIPQFLLARDLGWINTYYPLIVPWWLAGAIGTFLFRQFFLSVPVELEEAARIDGGDRWQIFRHVYLPLSGPVAATVAIFTLVAQWNNLIYPVVYLNSNSLLPVTVGLTAFQSQFTTQWNLLMAAALISMVPLLMVYAFAQRYFVEGMVTSGLKN